MTEKENHNIKDRLTRALIADVEHRNLWEQARERLEEAEKNLKEAHAAASAAQVDLHRIENSRASPLERTHFATVMLEIRGELMEELDGGTK